MYTAWNLPYVENLSFDLNSAYLFNDSVLIISIVFTFCRLDVDNLCVYKCTLFLLCMCVCLWCVFLKVKNRTSIKSMQMTNSCINNLICKPEIQFYSFFLSPFT